MFADVASVIKQMPRIPKAEDLSTLFDQQRENIQANRGLAGGSFGAGGSLGFGFRGTIPKLPSFKVRPPNFGELGSQFEVCDQGNFQTTSPKSSRSSILKTQNCGYTNLNF